MKTRVAASILVSLLLVVSCARKPAGDARADLEKQFQQMMTGATLVGRSTNQSGENLSDEERYIIDKATKLGGDTWLLQARIRYGSHDIPAPVPVKILWAGDTPVITLTDLAIPGLGTYTARVLLYRDQYAGSWSGKDHGGLLFGKIVHQP